MQAVVATAVYTKQSRSSLTKSDKNTKNSNTENSNSSLRSSCSKTKKFSNSQTSTNKNVFYIDFASCSQCFSELDTKSSESDTEHRAIYKNDASPSVEVGRVDKLKYTGPMETTFKCLVIGDLGVGKTSLVQKYVYNRKVKDYKATLGVDFALKVINWSENVSIKLQLWDIAGQERFTSMTRVYYRDAHACIIMFDLTNKETFLNALKWKNDLDSKCTLPDGSPVPCILLANKNDLPHREVSEKEITKFCTDHEFIGHGEISVKKDKMVEESMRHLLDDMMARYAAFEDYVDLDEYDKIVRLEDTTNSGHTNNSTNQNCSC